MGFGGIMRSGCILWATVFLFATMPITLRAAGAENKLDPIKHIIVIYLENHSFDSLFGTFPGAEGLNRSINPQTEATGQPYNSLPAVTADGKADTRFPADLPNQPFLITRYAGYGDLIPDMSHRYYQIQQQINGGKMDKFVQYSTAGSMVMGYYAEENSLLWHYAKKYTLADHFFTAALGGSLLNHFWLICGCTPHYDNSPDSLKAKLDDKRTLIADGALTPDGYAVNSIEPFSKPNKAADDSKRLPAQTLPTIGDRLSEKGISWVWYSGGWNDALKGNMGTFIPHHNPFLYFKKYGENTPARAEHLKDESDLMQAIAQGNLPQVVFYKPEGKYDFHPGYSIPKASEEHAFSIVKAIEGSTLFKDTIIIVTFDDSGGFYDHVAPPKRDRFGPGIRIPAIIISPYAKKGAIDHTTYDTTSILKLIENKFGLKPLNGAYKNAGDLTHVLR